VKRCMQLLQVSLFAELFNEMLVRDFAYCIYSALLGCPDKPAETQPRSDDSKKKGRDDKTRGESQKRDEKKTDDNNADKDSGNGVTKDTHKDSVGGTELKNSPEVCVFHCFHY